jgi:nucleotide-binding universal stress UspA family protein
MFTKILVPLDGSALAERALKLAFAIAKKFKSEILLVRVAAPEEVMVGLPAMAPHTYDLRSSNLRQGEAEADAYLCGLKTCWLDSGVPVHTEVLRGATPEMIVAVANEQQVDLIVMSTHGRSGFDRLIYGSVAEAVMRGSHVPVLMVPSKA